MERGKDIKEIKEQEIPSGKNWKKVLSEIYEYAPHTYFRNNKIGIQNPNHSLVKKLRMSEYEVMLCASFLEENGLLEWKKVHNSLDNHQDLVLTSKGFDVALQNEGQEKTQGLQKILALASVLSAILVIFSIMLNSRNIIALIAAFILIIPITVFLSPMLQEAFNLIFRKKLE